MYKFAPVPGGHRILHVGSDGGHNRTCQISSEPVQGFRSPGAEDNPLPLTWRIALLSSSDVIPAWFH